MNLIVFVANVGILMALVFLISCGGTIVATELDLFSVDSQCSVSRSNLTDCVELLSEFFHVLIDLTECWHSIVISVEII